MSTDNTNWTTIFSTTTGTGGMQTLTRLSGTGRYIRMYGTTRATQYGYSLWEFQVFATSTSGGSGGVDISAGGPAAAPFVADQDFSGGTATSTTNAITTTGVTNPAPQSVYQHNRYGNFTYTIPGLTAGASYNVRLDFAETYWTAAGSRTFNVLINGTQVLTSFDIFATAGGEYKAVAESFTATASSAGAVTIQFVTVKDNAQVNGIEVQPAGGGTGNTVTVTNPGAQTWTVGTAASLQIQASDSASGQTLTYSATGLPAGLSVNSSTGLISGTPTATGTGSATVTVKDTTGASGSATFSWTVNPVAAGCVGGSNQPNLGPNVYIFNPSSPPPPSTTTLNTIFNTQKLNQFGTQRYAELFIPGTYTGIEDNVGYYTSVQGLGQNPDQVALNAATSPSTPSTAPATPPRTSGARPRTWRSPRRPATTAGRSPRPARSSGWTSTAASSSTRPASATPAAVTSPTALSPARRPASPSSSGTPRTATSAAGAARCGTWCSPA